MSNATNSRGPLAPTASGEPSRFSWRTRLKALAYGAIFVAITTLALAIPWPTQDGYALQAGDVSAIDIRAPRSVEYISDILTEDARLQAERRVVDVYEPVRRVRSEQVKRAAELALLFDELRADTEKSADQKVAEIQALPDIQLTAGEIAEILSLSDEGWQDVQEVIPGALNVILLGEIRESSLAAARRRVPSYVDLEDESAALAAIALTRALIKPNTVFNEERTLAARDEARDAVQPQTERFAEGEIVVRAGDILNPSHIEALQQLGIYEQGWDWWDLASALLVSIALAAMFGLYIFRAGSEELLDTRRLVLLLAMVTTFLFIAKLIMPDEGAARFAFPLGALTMLVSALLGLPLTLLVTLYFGIVMGIMTPDPKLVVITYATVGSVIGALVLGRGERTSAFVRAGLAIALANILILAAFSMPLTELDLGQGAVLVATALVNGVLAASLTLIGFYLLGAIFDIATPLRLLELSRPNHPLLRDLITKAPGTYHHSLLVSNLAEQGAEAIGADPFLTRVGSYYHDIGKTVRPHFFVENNAQGVSPHSQLDPWSSAQIIISHVKDGMALAERYKLPRRVRDFIAEHQGTGLVRYFYAEAVKIAGEENVKEEDFRYPGPKPRSKETALLMLADSSESAVRAMRPQTRDEVDVVVLKILNQKLMEGELSNSPMTLQDLETVRQVFVRSLSGVHHPRIVYPDAKPVQIPAPANEQPEQPAAALAEPAAISESIPTLVETEPISPSDAGDSNSPSVAPHGD